MSNLAELKKDETLFIESFEKHSQASKANPDYFENVDDWVSNLMRAYKVTGEKTYLDEAEKKAKLAKKLNPDDLYNLASLKALQNDVEAAKKALLHCEKTDNLPVKADFVSDSDFDSFRELDWFKELLTRLE